MKKIKAVMGVAAFITLSSGAVCGESGRDSLSIVGSSTVYPFATVVAEHFGKGGKFKTPKVESTGTGGGIKLFCGGVGVDYPDIANASRRMKESEFQACKKSGVSDIVEVKIGFDGIVLAQSKKNKPMELTRKDVYLALAKRIPDPTCGGCDYLVENPYKTWNEVNPALPATKIEVLGPPPTSGTRDAFAELVLEGGCKEFKWINSVKKEDEDKFKKICHTLREDGAYVEAGENDNLIVQKLVSNVNAVGIFGYSFLEENADKVAAAKIEGVSPTFESIADGSYVVSRPLFFYVKKRHIGMIPGISEYLAEFTSEKAWGEDGYLSERGLIPLPSDERKEMAENAKKLKLLAL
ncbi:MAG: PstS family phosphate ABC transporter substrate-binding protein [Methylococcus sp.]|nr:PstS family phosphate ABC transporter substrate-binding protein [Methylococcus sp.]